MPSIIHSSIPLFEPKHEGEITLECLLEAGFNASCDGGFVKRAQVLMSLSFYMIRMGFVPVSLPESEKFISLRQILDVFLSYNVLLEGALFLIQRKAAASDKEKVHIETALRTLSSLINLTRSCKDDRGYPFPEPDVDRAFIGLTQFMRDNEVTTLEAINRKIADPNTRFIGDSYIADVVRSTITSAGFLQMQVIGPIRWVERMLDRSAMSAAKFESDPFVDILYDAPPSGNTVMFSRT